MLLLRAGDRLTDAGLHRLEQVLDDEDYEQVAAAWAVKERLRQIISVAKGLDTKYIRIFSFYPAEGQSPEDIREALGQRGIPDMGLEIRAADGVVTVQGALVANENIGHILDIVRQVDGVREVHDEVQIVPFGYGA